MFYHCQLSLYGNHYNIYFASHFKKQYSKIKIRKKKKELNNLFLFVYINKYNKIILYKCISINNFSFYQKKKSVECSYLHNICIPSLYICELHFTHEYIIKIPKWQYIYCEMDKLFDFYIIKHNKYICS